MIAYVRQLRAAWLFVAIGVAAIALRVGYLAITPYNVREHDVNGHVEYIEYLLAHHALPKNGDGFSFYHPPSYFLLAALQWQLLSLLHFARKGILVSLQVQSVLWELGFVGFSIATAKLWFDDLPASAFGKGLLGRRGLAALFGALILLWPSTVIHSARIGNDDPVYFFFGASLYFVSRWWLRGADRELNFAAIAAGLGVITKTNALVLFPVLGALFLYRLAITEKQRRVTNYLKRGWPIVASGFISAALALGSAVRDALAGHRPSLLIGNAYQVSTKLAVGNHAQNYLWFDVQTFVTQAWSSSWDDDHGRQWFWNFMLKTSLFGDFQFDSTWLLNLAVCISLVYVLLLGVFAVGLFNASDLARHELPLRVTAVVLVASLALLRMRHPNACSNDFRYILPVLAPFLCLYLRMLTQHRAQGRVRFANVGAILGWLFAALSTAFLVALVATSKRPS